MQTKAAWNTSPCTSLVTCLGFGHEQDAPGNEGPAKCNNGIDTSADPLSITAYDRDSIMNYCNRDGNMTGHLTDTDIQGVQKVYGVRRQNVASINSCQSAQLKARAIPRRRVERPEQYVGRGLSVRWHAIPLSPAAQHS